MKLASYTVDGEPSFGVVSGDGVITMNNRLGGRASSLRGALAADLLAAMREAAANAIPAGHS
jgi:hypothetical protein